MIRTILVYYIATVFRNLLDFYFSLAKKKAVLRKKKLFDLFKLSNAVSVNCLESLTDIGKHFRAVS